MKKTKLRETKIIEKLVENCYESGFYFQTEVPLFSSKIDLVTINPKNKEVIAVEAKISNWYRAVQQATSYTMCADKVYLAVWEDYIHRVNPELLSRYGMGLLSVNGSVEMIRPAKKTNAHKDLLLEIRNHVIKNN